MTTQATALTLEQVTDLTNKMNDLLKQFASDNGLVAGAVSAQVTAIGFDAKIGFTTQDINPAGADARYLKDLQKHGWDFGLTVDMLGTTVMVRTSKKSEELKAYTFMGMRATKVVAVDAEGTTVTFAAAPIAPMIINAYHTAA